MSYSSLCGILWFFLTHDGGQHWLQSSSVPMLQFRAGNQAALAFLDRTHWLITGQDVLLRSEDAGQSWQRSPLAQAYRTLISPSFISPSEGWAIGAGPPWESPHQHPAAHP